MDYLLDRLQNNDCKYCSERAVKNAEYIDDSWREGVNSGCWPKPYQENGIDLGKVKGIVVGQDPTIDNSRPIQYVLEADKANGALGGFLREVFDMLPAIEFEELYFTNLVKCRFTEKPGKGNRSISNFLDGLATTCYDRFLRYELVQAENARYVFTLGRDCFNLVARLLLIEPPSPSQFKDYYGTQFSIPISTFNRKCDLVPLPHQPTYYRAARYSPYTPDKVAAKMAALKSL